MLVREKRGFVRIAILQPREDCDLLHSPFNCRFDIGEDSPIQKLHGCGEQSNVHNVEQL